MKSLISLCIIVLICNVTDAKNDRPKKAAKNTTVTAAPSAAPSVATSAAPVATTRPPFLQGFRLPCSCVEGQCGCCTGVILDRFNQKACINVTYEPEDFALTAAMSMNGKILYKRSVSGKNPPPMCIRLPRFPFIRFCVKFSNIYFASRNVHLCIDMEANWEDLTLLQWSFDCVRMGFAGLAVVGVEEGGGVPASPIDAVDQTDEDYDDSARDAAPRRNRIVFDEAIAELRGKAPNRALVRVRKLPNGDIAIGRS